MTTHAAKAPLTIEDIVAYYDYEGGEPEHAEPWGGYGYFSAIGTRAAETGRIERGNGALIARANQLGWDRAMLWYFLNSKHGRWYGEAVVGLSIDVEAIGPYAFVTGITADGEFKWPKVAA